MAAVLLSRRVLLGWLGGVGAGLVVGTQAEAKPKPKPGLYTDVFFDKY